MQRDFAKSGSQLDENHASIDNLITAPSTDSSMSELSATMHMPSATETNEAYRNMLKETC